MECEVIMVNSLGAFADSSEGGKISLDANWKEDFIKLPKRRNKKGE